MTVVGLVTRVALAGSLLVAGPAALAAVPSSEIGPLVTVVGGVDVPVGLAVDGAGRVFVGEWEGTVRRAFPGRMPSPVAAFASVGGIAVDSDRLYVADPLGHRVWRVDDTRPEPLAGTGEPGAGEDGRPAVDAALARPMDVTVGADGAVYIADAQAHQIRVVRPTVTGSAPDERTMSTVAGTGEEGSTGDGGPATEAQLRRPFLVEAAPSGDVFVVESSTRVGGRAEGARVRVIDVDGTIRTVAGGRACDPADSVDAGARPKLCSGVGDIAVGGDGVLYLSDQGTDAVWALHPDGRMVRLPMYVDGLLSLTVSPAGDLFVGRRLTDERQAIQRVSLSVPVPPVDTADGGDAWVDHAAGTVVPVAGTGERGFSGDGGPAPAAQLAEPGRVAVGPDGLLYVADLRNGRVRSVAPDGSIATVAGNGEEPPPPKQGVGPAPGDGRPATEVPLWPWGEVGGVAAGADGSLYLSGGSSHRVFRVSPLGVVTTFAGTGERAYAGDGGLAVDAALADPTDVSVSDDDGSVYVADYGTDRVRRVDPTGVITTVAELDGPVAVAVAPDGTVYAVAAGQVWRIDTAGAAPTVTPYATGVAGPRDVAVGPDGLLYVASGTGVSAVLSDGSVSNVAGTGERGGRLGGEAGPADEVDLPPVDGVAFDPAGNLYLSHSAADQVTVVVRATDAPDGVPWRWVVMAAVAAVAAVAAAPVVRGRVRARRRRVR